MAIRNHQARGFLPRAALAAIAATALAAAAAWMTLPAAFAQQPDNRNPVAVADVATTAEDTAATVAVLANDSDPDGDTLSVDEVTSPAHGTAVINADGTVRYTPAANFHGTDTFAYTIEDDEGGEASALVTVTVTPVNDPPVLGDDVATTPKDTGVVVNVLANDSDADGDTLAVTTVSTPAHGTAVVNATANAVTYVPAAGFEGVDTFTYTVQDGHGGTNVALVTVTVAAADDDDDDDDGLAPDDKDDRKDECKDGGWHDLGFRNQGLCIAFGGDLDDLDDGPPWPLQEDWDSRHEDDESDHHGHGLGLSLAVHDNDDDADDDTSELHEGRGHRLDAQDDDEDDDDDDDDDHGRGRGRGNGHGGR